MKFNINNIRSRIGKSAEGDPTKIHLNPARDWLILLAVFFVLTIGVSIYSYNVFLNIYNEDTNGTIEDISVSQNKYDRFQKELSATLDYYQQKNSEYNQLLQERVDVVSDSLVEESAADIEGSDIDEGKTPVLTQ